MAISREVKCINKPDRESAYQRITHLGGDWGAGGSRIKVTEDDAIKHIESGLYTYHVKTAYRDVNVFVSSNNGRKYLRTTSDDTTKDNLLSLPECR